MTESINEDLSCNNCPTNQKKRCKEQQEKKDNLINFYLREIEKTAALYGYDISKQIKELKQTMPRITRCDVVLEKQLKRKEQECEELKNKLEKAENNCIKVFNLFSELGEKYTKLKRESEKYKNTLNKVINKPVKCTNCIHSKMNGFELICTEFLQVITDNEPLCSAFEPQENQLNGNEQIKDLSNDDICNYIKNNINGVKKIEIITEKYGDEDHKVLYIRYHNGIGTRICFESEQVYNAPIEELRQICLLLFKNERRRNAKRY